MKVIIIEGTDNVGKDTVINRLTYEFNNSNIYHCEKPKGTTPDEQAKEQELSFVDLLGKTLYEYTITNNYDVEGDCYCLIHNRSWYGEYVYGCMYRNNNPSVVKNMIYSLEQILTKVVKEDDLCFITLLSDNADFLVRNDDGLSISNADKGKIIHETQRFEEIFKDSIIKNKHIVYVNNGDKFRDKDDIYNEILSYIFPTTAPSVMATDEWLQKHRVTREQYNEIRNLETVGFTEITYYVANTGLTAQQIQDINIGIL